MSNNHPAIAIAGLNFATAIAITGSKLELFDKAIQASRGGALRDGMPGGDSSFSIWLWLKTGANLTRGVSLQESAFGLAPAKSIETYVEAT